jgi:hypothetical protein
MSLLTHKAFDAVVGGSQQRQQRLRATETKPPLFSYSNSEARTTETSLFFPFLAAL